MTSLSLYPARGRDLSVAGCCWTHLPTTHPSPAPTSPYEVTKGLPSGMHSSPPHWLTRLHSRTLTSAACFSPAFTPSPARPHLPPTASFATLSSFISSSEPFLLILLSCHRPFSCPCHLRVSRAHRCRSQPLLLPPLAELFNYLVFPPSRT